MKRIILSIIKDDISNTRFIEGLNGLGLSAGDHFLHLPETIFALLGMEDSDQTEDLYKWYLARIREEMAVTDKERLDWIAESIYNHLIKFAEQVKG